MSRSSKTFWAGFALISLLIATAVLSQHDRTYSLLLGAPRLLLISCSSLRLSRGEPVKQRQSRSLLSASDELRPTVHSVFSAGCTPYFDWQTVALMYSYKRSGQPGPITRLLSCSAEDLATYNGMDLAPDTLAVPLMNRHPVTGDWYPPYNKPASIKYWMENRPPTAEFVVILDADFVLRKPLVPWVVGAEKGRPVAGLFDWMIGCDNELAKLYTKHPELCSKVGAFAVIEREDLRQMAALWLEKSMQVREDRARWAINGADGWICETYGYAFAAAEVGLSHKEDDLSMLYPDELPYPGVDPIFFHYGHKMKVGDWTWQKYNHLEDLVTYRCGRTFPEPPDPTTVAFNNILEARRDLHMIECVQTINRALAEHHIAQGCKDVDLPPDPAVAQQLGEKLLRSELAMEEQDELLEKEHADHKHEYDHHTFGLLMFIVCVGGFASWRMFRSHFSRGVKTSKSRIKAEVHSS